MDGNKFDYLVVDAGTLLDEFADYLICNAEDVILIDRHQSSKRTFMPGLIEYINGIRFIKRENILIENFMKERHEQTYAKAISIEYIDKNDEERITENIAFASSIQKITNYVS